MSALDTERLVFIDESGCNISMSPTCGWAPRGQRLLDSKPIKWGENISVIGAIRLSGVVCQRSFHGPIRTEHFLDFTRSNLCPRLSAGDIVVLDNLKQHKAPVVREALEQVGASLLFLPPYSPDLNPIELCWSLVKLRLRQTGARNVIALKSAIRSAFRGLRPHYFPAWFQHCGYGNHFK